MPEVENKVEAFFHSKWTWIGLGVGGIGVAYYFHKKNAAAAAAAATTSTTNATSATDTSGTSADSSYGYDSGYSPINSGGYGYGAYGTTPSAYQYDPTTGQYEYTGTLGVTAPSTNVEWTQEAESQLVADGYNGITVAAALGKYILGAEMSQDQYGIVQAAVALVGPTPQAVPAPRVAPPATQTPAPPSSPIVGSPKYGVPISGTYIRNIANGAIYQVDTVNHTIYHLTYSTAKKLAGEKQFPHVTDVLPSDARLKYTNGGNI